MVLHTLIDDACLFAGPDPCADHDEFPREDASMPSVLGWAKCFPRHLAHQGYSSQQPIFLLLFHINSNLCESLGQGKNYLLLFFPVTFPFPGIREILKTPQNLVYSPPNNGSLIVLVLLKWERKDRWKTTISVDILTYSVYCYVNEKLSFQATHRSASGLLLWKTPHRNGKALQ